MNPRATFLLLLLAFSSGPAIADSEDRPKDPQENSKSTQKSRRERALERRLRGLERRLQKLEGELQAKPKNSPEGEPSESEDKAKGQERLESLLREPIKGIKLTALGVAGYTYNLNNPPGTRNQNRLRVSDIDHNSFSPTYFKLGLRRDTSGKQEWDLGFNAEVAAGRMVESTLSLDPEFLGGEELNLANAYVSLQIPTPINPLQVIFGRAYGWFGVESLDLYESPLYSLSYLANFTPYTNTGLFVEMELVSGLKYMQYIGNGAEHVDDNNESKTGGGRLTWSSEDETLVLSFHWIYGAEKTDNNGDQRLQLELDIVWKATPSTTVWGALHYGEDENGDLTGTKRARFGSAQLIIRQEFLAVPKEDFNRLAVIVRGTIFRDRGGNNSGIDQTLGEITAGFEVKPTSFSWLRFEYRLDTSNESRAWIGTRGQLSRRTQGTLSLAAALQF